MPRCVEVIIPLALEGTFSYHLPEELTRLHPHLTVGLRVVVPFGAKRYYTGIISAIQEVEQAPTHLKAVETILDESPLVSTQLLDLWKWVAYYYCCPLGSVLRDALPAGLLPESKTTYRLVQDFVATGRLTEVEEAILDHLASLQGKGITLDRLEHALGRRLTRPLLSLVELGAITSEELLQHRFRPKTEKVIRLAPTFQSQEAIDEILNQLGRAPRQALLLTRLAEALTNGQAGLAGTLSRKQLLTLLPTSEASLKGLISKGILLQEEHPISRLHRLYPPTSSAPVATRRQPLTKPVTLYYTTELRERECYLLDLIGGVLAEGGQVLYLTPSVHALPASSTFLQRLEALAGQGNYYPYHSLVSESIRVETFRHLQQTDAPLVVVGTRSAIFAPLRKLSLVIIEEEHEYLYKQQLVAPRYHARDVALWRAHQLGAQVVLTSMTPSAEVLFHALRGKYALIRPETSSSEASLLLPSLQTIDLQGLRDRRELPKGYSISPHLYEQIQATCQRGEKVLLLQNKRGYASFLSCQVCQQRIQCPHCDVSLTYHQARQALICHYCGHTCAPPTACPACGATTLSDHAGSSTPALRQVGYGIERVEEELQQALPQYKTLRLDSETLASKAKRLAVLEQLERGETQLLLGTQLIRNQPVWDQLGLVAVVQLDALLGQSDFRTQERVYQLLHQLRLRLRTQATTPPLFLLQTNDPTTPFLEELRRGDYDLFMGDLLAQREASRFPPFTRMTYIWLRAKEERLLAQVAFTLSRYLMGLLPEEQVDGPQTPDIARVEGFYRQRITIRRPYTLSYQQERSAYSTALAQLRQALPESSRVQIYLDVDPL